MSIRQHGNAASTATSVTYPLGDRVRNRGRGISLSEISRQASNQYGHHIEQEEDAGSGHDSGSGSDRDDHNEDQHDDEGHQSIDEDNHDNEDNTMTKESTVTQEPASTQPPGFPNFEQGLMPGGPQQSIKPGLTAIYPTAPPVTKSTSSETETITVYPSIKTTNAAGSNPSPSTSSPGQDLTSEAKASSSSVKQGSSGKGHTSRHSSSTTKSTSGGGIPTTATVSASFEPLTTSDASPSSSPDPVDNAAGASEEKQESSSGNSGKKGAIHGAVVGLLILGAILFFLWRRHKQNKRRNSSRSSTSQLLSPKSARKLPEKSNSPSPFDDSDDRGSVGRTSPWTFDGVAAAVRKTVRPSTSAIGLGAGVGVAITTGPSPVSPASSKGDAVSVGGLSSLSRGSSFSFTSADDYSCHESATSGTSSIFQATALAYPTPGRVTPVMGATGTARIVDISPKPQRPEMVMVKSNRNSSSAELLSLSRNPSNKTCGCRASKASASTATGGQWDKEACGCGGTCGCGGGSKRSTVTEVSPPPMAARSLYEALGGSGSGPGLVPVSNPSSSRPVTWMRQPSQPSPLSTARNSAASGASTYVPSPIGGTPAPERNRRSYMG
ncbi:hypothetical protein B0T20DRAFT_453192 [Sordaria brevicollis]|uniref:Uncharacterized protein n=1 Tax=Sordaria brevicollis TaxID=83679 RepID=A0AAE0UBW0_SORBR|nr:hypothetical protein B0T20DRAFT_453192 [Sordaria brevicollis]